MEEHKEAKSGQWGPHSVSIDGVVNSAGYRVEAMTSLRSQSSVQAGIHAKRWVRIRWEPCRLMAARVG